MKIIVEYQIVCDKHLNKDKCFFMVTTNTKQDVMDTIKQETGFCMNHSPIIDLGCPLNIRGHRFIN